MVRNNPFQIGEVRLIETPKNPSLKATVRLEIPGIADLWIRVSSSTRKDQKYWIQYPQVPTNRVDAKGKKQYFTPFRWKDDHLAHEMDKMIGERIDKELAKPKAEDDQTPVVHSSEPVTE